MSGFSNVVKGGWHPKGKEGGKESWRGDFKGLNQVAGWMGKGKDPSSEQSEHVSQPLSSLKDPSSFGPPPKHINFHGAAAVNETTPDRRGLGAPLAHEQIEQQNTRQREVIEAEEEEVQKPKSPPVPYRVNTTGLSTNNLPPPPVRRLDSPTSAPPISAKPAVMKPKPQLPPRLPPRIQSPAQNPSPPPPYATGSSSPSQGYVNQEAAARLANAGVSVPEFGIGGTNGASQTTKANEAPVHDLQSRFSQMRTDSGSPNKGPPPSVPAPRPANSADFLPPAPGFRDRHADTIDAGMKKWGGVTSRFNTFVEDRKFSANANKRIPRPPGPNSPVRAPTVAPVATPAAAPASPSSPSTLETQARKKPPPPPPKRAEMRAAPTMPGAFPEELSSVPAPPPVPHNTKPR